MEELLKRQVHNFRVQTWHSMSGLEHKYGLELFSPVKAQIKLIIFFAQSIFINLSMIESQLN